MTMAPRKLEERIAVLERKVAEIEVAIANGERPKDWRRTIGMFAGDEVMGRIIEAGRQWREAERRKARRKAPKARRAKS